MIWVDSNLQCYKIQKKFHMGWRLTWTEVFRPHDEFLNSDSVADCAYNPQWTTPSSCPVSRRKEENWGNPPDHLWAYIPAYTYIYIYIYIYMYRCTPPEYTKSFLSELCLLAERMAFLIGGGGGGNLADPSWVGLGGCVRSSCVVMDPKWIRSIL